MVDQLQTVPTHGSAGLAAQSSRLRGLIRATRPKQWVKNALVLAAPAAAGVATQPEMLRRASIACIAFCLVAAATYLINDITDRDEDRRHPVKRARPVASGLISSSLAGATAIALLIVGVAVGSLASAAFGACLLGYAALMTGYSLGLRQVAIVDLGVVASGFVLRVVGGGLATGVPVSQWLLIVVSFGSLFVIAGKRYGDLRTLDDPAVGRLTLQSYTVGYLRFITALSAAVMLIAYCLWAFTVGVQHGTLAELSVLPVTLAVLRYGLLLENGLGGAPEEILLRDRPLLCLNVIWAIVYGLGIYLGH